jgi:GNAT superfamily N-acetyltransferase
MQRHDAVRVRTAQDDDDLDALNDGNPLWMGEELTRELFLHNEGVPSGMFVAEIGGTPVAYADAVGAGFAGGRRGLGAIWVRPEYRGRGAATALWPELLDVCAPDRVPGIHLAADGDDDVSQAIALAHGLERGGLHIESDLDLTSLDVAPELSDRSAVPGVEIAPLPDDADESQWRAFADVFNRLILDTPDASDGVDPMSYEILRTFLVEPWQVMAAWQGDRIVGFTAVVVRDAAARRLNTQLTAVERDIRGRGLATALKLAQARALAASGWKTITTQNMEGNAPILASNKTLGFRAVRSTQDLTYDY